MDVQKAAEFTVSSLTLKEKTLAKDLLYSEQYHKDTLSVKFPQYLDMPLIKVFAGVDPSTGPESKTSFGEDSYRGTSSGLQGSFLQHLL